MKIFGKKISLKRVIDLALVTASSPVWVPVLGVTYLLVEKKLGSPVFFVQERGGQNGDAFELYKFRTMTSEKDKSGELLPDEKRLTGFGKLLRKTSLDEIPSLINVLKGEMSLVGPRPLLTEYLDRYTKEQFRRHLVKPGITGWAQVNGRNAISWNEKFEKDLWYVENQSTLLDAKIVLLTLQKVLMMSDINQAKDKPMERFRGTLSLVPDDAQSEKKSKTIH